MPIALVNTAGTAADQTLIAAVAGHRIKVRAAVLVGVSNVAIRFKDGASTNLTGAFTIIANTPFILNPAGHDGYPYYWFDLDGALVLNTGAVVVNGWVDFHLVRV